MHASYKYAQVQGRRGSSGAALAGPVFFCAHIRLIHMHMFLPIYLPHIRLTYAAYVYIYASYMAHICAGVRTTRQQWHGTYGGSGSSCATSRMLRATYHPLPPTPIYSYMPDMCRIYICASYMPHIHMCHICAAYMTGHLLRHLRGLGFFVRHLEDASRPEPSPTPYLLLPDRISGIYEMRHV